jgi:integrase
MTLNELAALFFTWSEREAKSGRGRVGTISYYRRLLRPLLAVAGESPLIDLKPWDLEQVKKGWHSVQAAQRLLNWAVNMGLASDNPFKRVTKPPLNVRDRTASPKEERLIRRRSGRPLRDVLLCLSLTGARPTEVRLLRWSCYHDSPMPHFALKEFKARDRRRDGQRVRIIPVVTRLVRLLGRLARREHELSDAIFLNEKGIPWTGNALSHAFRKTRRKCGISEDLVPYSLRHTAATRACVAGVRDKLLAELLGHTSTRTTARYQHPDLAELAAIAERINARPRRTG